MSVDDNNLLSLKWNNYQDSMTLAFRSLLDRDYMTDVTIHSGQQAWKAHKVLLCASSCYFEKLLEGLSLWQHPVLVLDHIKPINIQAILEYIYSGGVTLDKRDVLEFMQVGQMLKVQGLTRSNKQTNNLSCENSSFSDTPPRPSMLSPDRIPSLKTSKTKRLANERKSETRRPKERRMSDKTNNVFEKSEEHDHFILDSVKEEPQDTESVGAGSGGDRLEGYHDGDNNLQDEAEMVVVKADPEDFHDPGPEPPVTVSELGPPLTLRNDLLGPPVKVGNRKTKSTPTNIFTETGRCHFCSEICGSKEDLTEHLKLVHMPVKHALCDNCENFFHVCAIQRHKDKCQARYTCDA